MTTLRDSPALARPPADWRLGALCRGVGDAFFPIGDWTSPADQERAAVAREICSFCPARAACLQDAIDSGDAWGIRGGTTPEERRGRR